MRKISAIVLTQNEEEFLPGCLRSLQWVEEIIVVDSGSTDNTLSIATEAGAKIVSTSWTGFPQQRNQGAQEAKGEWLLYVDADERVSPKLRAEIQQVLKKKKPEHSSYKIPHRNIILGKWLRFGGWYPEHQHRLMKKDALKEWVGELHEHPELKGSVGYLTGDLVHLTHRGMRWMLEKTIQYTHLEAKLRLEAGHPKVSVKHLFSAPAREVWHRCVKKSGWRDGIIGWIEIIYQSFNQFLIMAWLWEMQQDKSMKKKYTDLDKETVDEL
ncbi:glycosyltransferase family 2 protein [Patescibacteria group bacterium]|nr:glycosyltransferase family 2 protein [Patescibacteria group bacterium]